MTLRVTEGMMSRRLLSDLGLASRKIADAQREISTGKRITKPSDDPTGAHRAIVLRGQIAESQRHAKNVDEATGWLTTTDTALASMQDIVHRVRELTVQGANDTTDPDARNAIALEIDQLADALKTAANANYAGQYVFSGTQTTTAPYAPGSDTYQGDAGTIAREIGPGVSVQINALGSTVVGSGGGDGKLLATLRNIAADLRAGTAAGANSLRTTDLQDLDTNLDTLGQARSIIGATQNRLDAAATRLADITDANTKLLSDTEDADMSEAILDLTTQQTVYQAALRAGASIIQTSLMDFLR